GDEGVACIGAMVSSARFSTMPLMRSALLFCAAMSVLGSVHASDRWICMPAPDHSGWQCTSSDGSQQPSAPTTNPSATTAPQRTAQAAAPKQSPVVHVLDWVPRNELPASRLASLPEYCDGAYVEPAYTMMTKDQIASAPIHAHADQVEYYLQEHG